MTDPVRPTFFSYSREDSEFVLRLAKDLRAAGVNIWLDLLDIGPGERWDSAVQTALSSSFQHVLVLSPAAVRSENVMDEISYALDNGKRIIPVLYRDCNTPYRLRRFQHIDCRTSYDGGFQDLLKTLKGGELPVPKKSGLKKRWAVACGAGVLLVAGAIWFMGYHGSRSRANETKPTDPTRTVQQPGPAPTLPIYESPSQKQVSRGDRTGGGGAELSTARDKRAVEGVGWREVVRLTQDDEVNAVAFSPDGRYLAIASDDERARVFEAATGTEISHEWVFDPVQVVHFSADGRYVAAAAGHRIEIFEAASGKTVSSECLSLESSVYVESVVISPDGRYFAVALDDRTARICEIASNKEVARFAHEGRVFGVAFSPDGRYVATASYDKTARVFEANGGKEIVRLSHEDAVLAVAFSPDGRYLATASFDKTARVFEVANWKQLARFQHGDKVIQVIFSPNGRYIATASLDKTARVFEVASKKEISRLSHQNAVIAVAFSPDGRYVATASFDKTSRVFEVATGKQVALFRHQDIVVDVAFSSDGRYVATASRDKTARVFGK